MIITKKEERRISTKLPLNFDKIRSEKGLIMNQIDKLTSLRDSYPSIDATSKIKDTISNSDRSNYQEKISKINTNKTLFKSSSKSINNYIYTKENLPRIEKFNALKMKNSFKKPYLFKRISIDVIKKYSALEQKIVSNLYDIDEKLLLDH